MKAKLKTPSKEVIIDIADNQKIYELVTRSKTKNLLHGDCFELMKKIPDNSIDLCLTDPPYNISVDNNFKTMKDREGRKGINFGDWDKSFNYENLKMITKTLKKNGSVLIFHSFEQYSEIKKIMEASGLICKDKILWDKSNPMPRNRERRYISHVEMGTWFVKKNAKWVFNRQDAKYQKMVFKFPSESGGGFKRFHPTQKNLKLLEELIKIHTNENDVVFDPFMGSGSTGVAAKNLNRKFIGIEKDETYFNIAKKRIIRSTL